MSRSYKKTPGFTDNKSRDDVKRKASKAVRRQVGAIGNGSNYKKIYCSYNICDWKFLEYHSKNKRRVKVSDDYKRYIK